MSVKADLKTTIPTFDNLLSYAVKNGFKEGFKQCFNLIVKK